jgi:hypothetical protein
MPAPAVIGVELDHGSTADHCEPACSVDLRGRLSNPGIRDIVAHTAKLVSRVSVDHGSTSAPRRTARRWRLVDRLGEQIILEIVRSSHAGTTHRALAERYGISLSSVKRVLRRHRC